MKNNPYKNLANRKVLVIGTCTGVFTSQSDTDKTDFEYCENMLDAISLAANTEFKTIAVVLGDFDENLNSALKTLNRLMPGAKIILLAQMYEEPRALQLIRSSADMSNIANDYYICPVSPKQLGRAQVKGNGQKQTTETERLPQSDEQIERVGILEKLATEDELTGIKNRRYVREFLRQIIERCKREDFQATILVFDIDDFKSYNDLYGHSTGDTILKQAAILMQKCCRKHDVVSRIGGDEFAVVFWNCKNKTDQNERRVMQNHHPDEATIICERFRREINNAPLPALGVTGKGQLSISGGLATFPRDGSDVNQLFEQADHALLEAKRSGKNRVFLVSENTPSI